MAEMPGRAQTASDLLVNSQRRKAVVASTIGTTIEWYDFFLYGTMAALVFPSVFFPGGSTYSGILESFAARLAEVARREFLVLDGATQFPDQFRRERGDEVCEGK